MKRVLTILAFVSITIGIKAQDMAQYNHYIANQGLLNPAYNGTRDVISGLILHRSQWVGMEGAPMNEAINVHGPIEDTNLGVGVSLANDHLGLNNTFDFFGALSYKFAIDRKQFVSLGLQLGVSSFSQNGSKAITNNYNDPAAQTYSKISFNTGFGAYYYGGNYFAGYSIPKFFNNHYDLDELDYKNTFNFNEVVQYLYGGYVFEWGAVMVKPTLLSRIEMGAPITFDLSTNVLINEKVWLGLGYRSTSDLLFLTEYVINRQFTVRYSFDYTFSKLSNYAQFGSHELGIQFDFTFSRRPGMRSIRYF